MNCYRTNSNHTNLRQKKQKLEEWKNWLMTYGQSAEGCSVHQTKIKQKPKNPPNPSNIVTSDKKNKKSQSRALSLKLKDLADAVNSVEFVASPIKRTLQRGSVNSIARVRSQHSIDSHHRKSHKTASRTQSTVDMPLVECETVPSFQHIEQLPSASQFNSSELLRSYREIQDQELEKIIAWKEAQVELIRKQNAADRARLMSQVSKLDHENTELSATNKHITQKQKQLQETIQKLQTQIDGYKQQLRTHKDQISFTMSSSGVRVEKDFKDFSKLRSKIEDNDYQLGKARKLNREFEGLICDLHIQNRFYRNRLEKCGEAKTKEFIEEERRMIMRSQERRKM